MNTHTPRALRLYGRVFEALTPLWRWWLGRRLQRGKETLVSLDQRWMRLPPPRPEGTLVWGHAVGVGEALALAGLLKRLAEQRPDLHFLITTTARTSGQALAIRRLVPSPPSETMAVQPASRAARTAARVSAGPWVRPTSSTRTRARIGSRSSAPSEIR